MTLTRDLRFDGEVAITGAGNGLGRSYAIELAARGAAIVCNDLVASAATATVEEILHAGGKAVPEFSSAFSRAFQGSTGSSVKSTLMPVACSNAGATSSTRHQCQGPLSPT